MGKKYTSIAEVYEEYVAEECLADLVNHPPHYTQYSFEVIEVIDEVTAYVSGQDGYMIGNVIKYILRAPFKGGLESLKKAKWYLDNLIERVENEGGTYGIKR